MLTGTRTNSEDRAEARDTWSTGFINNLPDSAFALIEDGGTRDSTGRTTPRTLRHFPHHGTDGSVDLPHLRNALARVPQSTLSQTLKDRALRHLRAHADAMGVGADAQANSDPPPAASAWRSASQTEVPGMGLLSGVECRAFGAPGLEIRANARNDLPTIVGYASVFDSPTFIGGPGGGFTEVVKPGAFSKSIRTNDVRALFNHDENLVLGRLDAGTLRLEEDRHGLRMEIDPPNTSLGRDVVEMVRRGDVSGASFGFVPIRQQWTQNDPPVPDQRALEEVKLYDVSPVTFPAYAEAEAGVRAAAWARRSLAGGALSDEELAMVRRLLPQWTASQRTQQQTAPGGASTSVQGPPEPGASDPRRQRLSEVLASLTGHQERR